VYAYAAHVSYRAMATKASAPESKSPAPATPAASASPRQIVLDGNSLTPEHLYDIGYDWSISIALSDAVRSRYAS